jgi:hypothetical protein
MYLYIIKSLSLLEAMSGVLFMFDQNYKENIKSSYLSYDEIKEIISRDYIQPLLDKVANLNQARKRFLFGTLIVEKPLFEIEVQWSHIPDLDEDQQKICKGIIAIYSDKAIQENKFPSNQRAEIQTCIRELLHDHLNPIEGMSMANLKQKVIENKKKGSLLISKTDPTPLPWPSDLTATIYSYLDYKSCKKLSLSCKAAYFLHHNMKNNIDCIFYTLGTDIVISRERKWNEGALCESSLLLAQNKIKGEVIIKSILNTDRGPSIELYTSLYQAVAYAHHLQQGGGDILNQDRRNNEEPLRRIPTIWAVCYQKSKYDLNFSSKHILGADLYIPYAKVERESVRTLVGAVVCSDRWFANYELLKIVDHQTDLQNQNNKTNCNLM